MSSGAQFVVLMELDRLVGVPYPDHAYGGKDVWQHTMEVLQIVSQMTSDTKVRWAAVCHDLAKGVTPQKEWLMHYDYERKSKELAEQLSKRLKTSRESKELAVLVANLHMRFHRLQEIPAEKVVKLLNEIDARRRPERLLQFSMVCEADGMSKQGEKFQSLHTQWSKYFLFRAARETCGVDVSDLVEAGVSGKRMKQMVHQRKVSAVKRVRAEMKKESRYALERAEKIGAGYL